MINYDSSKPSTYIQYLETNNLYGWAMSQPLPTHGFKWMKDLTVDSVIDLLERRKSNKGVIYSRLTWNILVNCGNHIMVILLHRKRLS